MFAKSMIFQGMETFLCHFPGFPGFPVPVDTLTFAVSDVGDHVCVHAGEMKVHCTNVCHLQPCYITEEELCSI